MNDMLMTLGRWQYSPDFNPDEVIGDWIREDVTANTCFGTTAKVREKVNAFCAALIERTTQVNSVVGETCKPWPTHFWRQPVNCSPKPTM